MNAVGLFWRVWGSLKETQKPCTSSPFSSFTFPAHTYNTDLPLSAISASCLIDTCGVWIWLVKPHGARLEENLENPYRRKIYLSRQSGKDAVLLLSYTHTHIFICPSFKVGQGELHLAVFSTTHLLLLSTLMRCLWRGYCWSLECLR